MIEEWRPIPGYEGRYSVSDQGRVRSEARLTGYRKDGRPLRVKETILSPILGSRDHLMVGLYKDGKRTGFLIHRLVLLAFVGPPGPDEEGCHYPDPDPRNNRLDNLMWGTRSLNQRQAVETRNHASSKKVECKYGHAFDEGNTFIDHKGNRQCRKCRRRRLRESRARARRA